jgi:signal peptidase I
MLPTLQPQDRAWVDKTAYGLRLPGAAPGARVSPRRGDVIVFRASGEEARQGPAELVKRVIGLPGDRIDFEDGRPVVNGWPIPACDVGVYFHMSAERLTRGRLVVEFLGDEAYLTVREPGGRPFVGYTVRPGELFVLGDNRGLSNDSRSWNGQRGAGVPLSAVLGQVRRVLYGFDRDGAFAWRRVGAALGPEVDLSGVDVRPLVEGVAECLARRPPQTLPPAPLVAGRGG